MGLSPDRLRGLLRVLCVALLLLVTISVRVVTSAASELERGQALQASGDLEAAVVHYRRAARWYAPASPYHVRALTRLAAIGAQAEAKGDVQLALGAYRAIRGAIMAARSWYIPERDRLRAADERIATLMAAQPRPPMDEGKSEAQLRAEHLALLTADRDPSRGWTAVLLIGFFAWVAGAFALTFRAVDAQDRFVPRELWRWGSVVVLGFGLFVLGMSLA